MPPNNATGQDMYNRYTGGQQGPASYPTGTPPSARSNSYPSGPQAHPAAVQQQTATSQPSSPSQPPTVSSYSCPQDYYRQEQVIGDIFILVITLLYLCCPHSKQISFNFLFLKLFSVILQLFDILS